MSAYKLRKVKNMRKDIIVLEMETKEEEANKAVKEIDAVVYKVTSAANNGKVRPSASGLVRNASGLVRQFEMLTKYKGELAYAEGDERSLF